MICPRCGAEADTQATTCRVCLAPLGVLAPDATIAVVAPFAVPDATQVSAAFETSADAFATMPGTGPLPPPADAADATISGLPTPVRLEGGLLPSGTDFGSRYHIIRTLGAGAMGSVYHAWDKELGVAVALKIMSRSRSSACRKAPTPSRHESSKNDSRANCCSRGR
jgi:hypothetical protein